MKIKTDASSVYDEFQKGLQYQSRMGFQTKWAELVDFVEGKQWPAATPKTKFMPRPVINQCDFIVENKKSNILSQNIKILFTPSESALSNDQQVQVQQAQPQGEPQQPSEPSQSDILLKAATEYSNAAESTWDDLGQNTLNEEAVDDTLILGTSVFHYYMDMSVKGGQFTPYVGALRGETIDPMDIVLGNPHLYAHQTQKQPYIIIRSPMDIDDAKAIVKANGGDTELIQPDNNNSPDEKYDNARIDIENNRKVTTYLKYFKQGNQIYWSRSTRTVTMTEVTSLSPENSKPFTLYPIEILVFKRRRKCTFGRSIIEDVIPSQKALNWQLGMMLLSVQQTAWPKLIAKVNALAQQVTNEPGEILVDHYGVAGVDGVKYMQPPNFTQMPMVLSEKIVELLRQTTGTTEVTSGEVMGANMAAAAIMALQNQAKKPNDAYQNKLYASMKNVGRIYEEFFKTYFNQPKPILHKDIHGNNVPGVFEGTKYADVSFSLKVNVGPTSVFSDPLQMNTLDMMANKGWVNKYEYVKYAPQNVVSQELKHDYEQQYQKVEPFLMEQLGSFIWNDRPRITIAFNDLPQDAQIQVLQQMGIQSQGGLTPELQVDLQKSQMGTQVKQQQLTQNQQKDTVDAHIKTLQTVNKGGQSNGVSKVQR